MGYGKDLKRRREDEKFLVAPEDFNPSWMQKIGADGHPIQNPEKKHAAVTSHAQAQVSRKAQAAQPIAGKPAPEPSTSNQMVI